MANDFVSKDGVLIPIQVYTKHAIQQLGDFTKYMDQIAKLSEQQGRRIAKSLNRAMSGGNYRGGGMFSSMGLMNKNQMDAAVSGYREAGKKIVDTKKWINDNLFTRDAKSITPQRSFEGLMSKQTRDQVVGRYLEMGRQATDNAKAIARQNAFAKKSIISVDDMLGKFNKKIGATGKAAKAQLRPFAGWAMSIMFFGMALKRVFDTIWKESTKVFQDVMHSTEGTVTGFDRLTGELDYLKFNVGAALEPVVTLLIPIISAVSDWVSQNQALTAGILVAMGVFGTFFLLLGTGWLAMEGFIAAWTIFSSFNMAKSIAPLAMFFATPVGVGVLAALGLLITLGAITWGSFKSTPGAWESILDSIKKLGEPLKKVTESFDRLITEIFNIDGKGNLAWFFAWLADIVVKSVTIVINHLTAMMNTMTAVIKGFKNFKGAISGDVTAQAEMKIASQLLLANNDLLKQGVGDLFDVIIGGPSKLKKNQQTENNAEFWNNAPPMEIYLNIDGEQVSKTVIDDIWRGINSGKVSYYND